MVPSVPRLGGYLCALMLKLDLNVRYALIVASLLLGVGLIVWQGFWYGFPFLLVTLVLIAGYILLGTIRSASELLQEQKIDAAEAQLAKTRFPQYLFPANKAYYYMIQANIALVRKDGKKAESLLREASKYEMPSGNEAAVIELQLANIAAQKNNWPEVNQRIQSIRKLKVTEPMILEQAGMLEKAYRNRGNVKMAQRMGVGTQGQGSKRRRPKMR